MFRLRLASQYRPYDVPTTSINTGYVANTYILNRYQKILRPDQFLTSLTEERFIKINFPNQYQTV